LVSSTATFSSYNEIYASFLDSFLEKKEKKKEENASPSIIITPG